jgi:hypothetical protein
MRRAEGAFAAITRVVLPAEPRAPGQEVPAGAVEAAAVAAAQEVPVVEEEVPSPEPIPEEEIPAPRVRTRHPPSNNQFPSPQSRNLPSGNVLARGRSCRR